MKHRALTALALLVTACAHDERPATPSAAAVEGSTDVPANNPDFTPPENRVGDTDAGVQPAPGTTTTPSSTWGTSGTTASGTNGSPPAATTSSKAESGVTTKTASAGPTGTPSPRPDNTDVNERDRSRSAVTPMDQGESEADRTITQQIRQAVMKDGSLSFTAKNVKIITLNKKVTLRGPVKSAAERTAIETAAKKVAGVTSVENQLEIAE